MDREYSYDEGFQFGVSGNDPRGAQIGGPGRLFEVRLAVENWRRAESDHAETSYWGTAHIRAMRAYWLGCGRGLIAAQHDKYQREAIRNG